MPTVYVFGAGASFDAGYPLAADMGEDLLEFMRNSKNVLFNRAATFLEKNLPGTSNIEDLITNLQSRFQELDHAQSYKDRELRWQFGIHQGKLSEALRAWLLSIEPSPGRSYKTFASRIAQPGDVVITFNYDDSLERDLRQAGKWNVSHGYGFPLGTETTPSDVLVLKLHGSVNWIVPLFGGATGGTWLANPSSSMGDLPVIHSDDLKRFGYDEPFSGCTYQSGGTIQCLILPGRSKEFFFDTSFGHEFEDFWDCPWSRASNALKKADKVVICGYSLPAADQRARGLLFTKTQRQAEIEVSSGKQSKSIKDEFQGQGFSNVKTFGQGYFSEWCKCKAGKDANPSL